MKKRYWWAALLGLLLGLGSCQKTVQEEMNATYPIQGISVYQGQSLTELYDDNGAPNITKNLDNGAVMWVYYTNFRPVGGGEIISYDNPPAGSAGTTCSVKVILAEGKVVSATSDCN